MSDDAANRIGRQDEVLELLYWLEGEGIGGSATLEGMSRFMARPDAEVQAALDDLLARGDVARTEAREYRLTDVGRREAARRFAEEFAGMLGQGHGECNDPECECHDDPAGAVACHARRHENASKP